METDKRIEELEKKEFDATRLLCRQMELLAKESGTANTEMLIKLSNAMCDIYSTLKKLY